MLVFAWNLIYSWVIARVPSPENPWQSRGIEWMLPSPVPVEHLKTDPKKVEEKKTMLKADVEPAKPVDNRQSWGKYEPLDPVAVLLPVRPEVEIPDQSKTHLRVLRDHREKRALAFFEILLVRRRPA